jgi:hypothetical protein
MFEDEVGWFPERFCVEITHILEEDLAPKPKNR